MVSETEIKENGLDMAYTIERQLMMYTKLENSSERYKVLWNTWNANKRWLTQMLEWTLPSFPSYSRHNSIHADAVLHNIERMLGEKRIRMLAATDCFMLLHASYIHDIGMSITAMERQEMTKDDLFQDLVEKLEQEGDADQRKAAESLLRTQYTEYENLSARERSSHLKSLFREKLDVYYGLGQLMSEYQRNMHAEKVKKRMKEWMLNPEDLGNGFSSSGIPLRLFLRISDCAAIHATSGIDAVLELPYKDSGYVMDNVHPRFIAIMLQLGDALDMDNDRVHPFTYQFVGNFPRMSTLHLKKHQAIRQLNITPESIQIQADCDSQDVLRMVRMECESLDEILKNASYHWPEIAPHNMPGCLPTLNQQQILLDGQKIPKELVKAQFNISQVRAFRLLEGANVYGGRFVFLRELLQNACDATKLQCWEDYIYKSKLKDRLLFNDVYEIAEYGLNPSEKEILEEVDVWEYPVELFFEIGVQIRDKSEEILFVPIEEIEEYIIEGKQYKSGVQARNKNGELQLLPLEEVKEGLNDNANYGVRVTFQDHGTGISKDDLMKISDVGSSYEEKKHFIDKMPDWLKPTGQFGIGLQSAFLVSDTIKARTYTRSGERYEINFNKVSNGSGGYINVKPLPAAVYVKFGTAFEVFVKNRYKKLHTDCWEAWNTDSEDADRFSDNYDKRRSLRHATELLSQMILSVDEMLGENIFPVYVYIRGKSFNVNQYDFLKKRIKKLALQGDVEEEWRELQRIRQKEKIKQKEKVKQKEEIRQWDKNKDPGEESSQLRQDKDGYSEELEKEKYIGWLFRIFRSNRYRKWDSETEKNFITVDIKDGIAVLDCQRVKLCIWNNVLGVFAQFGGKRLLLADSAVFKNRGMEQTDDWKIRVFLKGIYVQSHFMYQDSELLELIDIKGGKIGKSHIAINRNEFTREGLSYLEEEIYPSVIVSAKEALVELNELANQNQEKCFDKLIECAIHEKFLECQSAGEYDSESKRFELEEMVLSAVGLSYFLRVLGKEPELLCVKKDEAEICHWDKLLELIADLRVYSDDKADEKNPYKIAFTEYINRGMMREMAVYSYQGLSRNRPDLRQQHLDYSGLLLEQRKIAILSLRMDAHSKWFYIPIEIYNANRKEGNYFEVFMRKPTGFQDERKVLGELENWADGILEAAGRDKNYFREEYGEDAEIQYTLKYMLENIPSVGVYANGDGNLRVNVLSEERPKSVFYNRNAKKLVLKKAQKLHDENHAKRFMTGVWRGYECLSLENMPSSVHTVNGVYIARQQTERMLLPILGDNIGKLFCLKDQKFFKDIEKDLDQCNKLEKICSEYFDFERDFEEVFCQEMEEQGDQEDDKDYESDNILRNFLRQQFKRMDFESRKLRHVQTKVIARNYWQKLVEYILILVKEEISEYEMSENRGQEISIDINELLINEDVDYEKRRMFFQIEIMKLFMYTQDDVRLYPEDSIESEGEKIWKWFTKSLFYIRKHQRGEFMKKVFSHPEFIEFRDSLWGNTGSNSVKYVKKNIVDYVSRNAEQKLTEKQIISCYEKLFDDIIASVIDIDKDKKENSYPYINLLIN